MDYFENNNSLLLENFSYWENRKLYLQLMEKFVNGRIDRDKNYSFKELLDKIEDEKFTECDVFEPESALKEDYEISEEELRNCVKKTLLEIKDRYP